MKYISVGDMSQTYLMRRHNTQLKNTMTTLSEELITGVQKDLGVAVKGDFTALSALNLAITRTDAYKQVAAEADLLGGTQQESLKLLQDHALEMGSGLIAAARSSVPAMVNSGVQDAAIRFDAITNALNVSYAGRYAFSGVATDTKPVASSEVITAALAGVVSSLTTANDIAAAVEAWFAAPTGGGGYLDTAYAGSNTPIAPVQVSETDRAEFTITAADTTLRNTLKGFALATLVAEGHVPNVVSVRAELAETAGNWIMTADTALSTLRSELGTVEAIVGQAQTRNAAQTTSLGLAKNELIGIDAYESATALEAVQGQLETLYTLTTRLSQLSLTDYL